MTKRIQKRRSRIKRNANKWSTCSLEAITKFVSEVSCHFNTPSTDPYPLFSWQELTHNAQVPHLSDQCFMYLPRKEGITDENVYGSCGTDLCQYLECIRLHKYTNDDTGCAVHERQSAMEGSECGHNWVSDSYQQNHCFQGNCIAGKYAVGSYNTHIRAN